MTRDTQGFMLVLCIMSLDKVDSVANNRCVVSVTLACHTLASVRKTLLSSWSIWAEALMRSCCSTLVK